MAKPARLFNLANFFTALRFFLTPFLVTLYVREHFALAFWLTLFLGSTDWLDGFFARKFDLESPFGKLFDPVADKTLMISLFVTLGYLKAVPLGVVFLCLSRDALIILGSLVMLKKGWPKNASPTKASKINTFLQIALILVITYRLQRAGVSPALLSAENSLIWLTCLFTFASGVQYAKIFWRFLKNV